MRSFDYYTLILYILGVLAIALVSAKRNSNQKDMFAAGRQAPWWASGLSGFMTMFSAGTFVVWGGIAYKLGIVAILINMCYGIAALLAGYFVAGKWNQLGVTTPAEYINLRFGKIGLHFYTWTMLLKKMLAVAVSLYALAIVLVALIPLDEGNFFRNAATGNLSLTWAVIFFGLIVIMYTMIGGLWAVLMTDVVQFIILTLVVFLVAVLMIDKVDNFDELVTTLPETFFSPTSGDYGWFFLFGWVTINFFIIGAEWAFVQRFLAVKSPSDAKKSTYLFGIMYLVTPILWLLPPLIYRGVNPNANPEQAYIMAAQSVLPVGVLGLMFAAMFSATASMVSSQLNVFAGVLTNDFYRPLMNPNASGRVLVRVGRIFTAILGLVLIMGALLVPIMGGAEKVVISINSLMVVPLLAPALWGMFSRKIGIKEMCIVTLTSFAIGAFLRFGLSIQSKDIDVLVGVLLPILMLIIFQRFSKNKVDKGWNAIEELRISSIEDLKAGEVARAFDTFPGKVVIVSLVICAIGLFFLTYMSNSGRMIITILGIGLLLISLLIHLGMRKMILKDKKL
ncbi:sodium:solute symporter family protein [Maribacter sp. Asnod2-G09]|uniref:sodium:solute symporter family protein n=1 Tax=Maribacter sp. Asnod2-G09 TaxID=3160577 RepID=UPI00386C4C8A